MDEVQIYTQLSEVFHDVFDEDSINLTPSLSAKDVDGWDSLTHIRLILTIERASWSFHVAGAAYGSRHTSITPCYSLLCAVLPGRRWNLCSGCFVSSSPSFL